MWESLLGVIVGSGLTLTGTYLTNKKEEKRFEKSFEHEKKKFLREGKLNTLQNVLKPIIELYAKSDAELELIIPLDYSFFGDGLQSKYINELKNIVKKNNKDIPVSLAKEFNKLDTTYNWIISENFVGQQMFLLEEEGESVMNCMFDEKRIFIERIEKEAEDIENEYTK